MEDVAHVIAVRLVQLDHLGVMVPMEATARLVNLENVVTLLRPTDPW